MALPYKWRWYLDLLRVLVRKELNVRYKGNALGYMWSVLNPLANAYIFYVVFGIMLRMNVPHFIVLLLAALFPWQAFSNSIMESTTTFLANPTLVKKIAFPRAAIPLVVNAQNYVHLLLSFPIYLAFMFYEGLYPGWNWLWGIPALLLLTFISSYGISLLFGTLNVFFRDLRNLVGIFIQLAFFGTPIMYVLSAVPESYMWVFKVNPIAPLFICWRSMLVESSVQMEWFMPAVGYAILFVICGYLVFHFLKFRFAEVI